MSMETINFDNMQLKPGEKILDVGCGEGRHSITAYSLEDLDCVGVDLSLTDLKTTRSRFEEINPSENNLKSLNISVANGQKLPFADNSFDKVICSEVLEHIPDYRPVLGEISRVLKTGGIFAASVPRFFPEWVCWQLSDDYHAMEGGHIRIFNAKHLKQDIEAADFIFFKHHYAHALHVPYWWLKCLFWRDEDQNQTRIVDTYHKFLVWDLMQKPWITTTLDRLMNPILGKSVVMYFVKTLASEQPINQTDTTQNNTNKKQQQKG